MSQSVEVTLVLASVEALAEAIRALGATWRECGTLKSKNGATHKVDHVVTAADGTEVGVRVDPRTKRAVLVAEGCGSKAEAFAGQIAQRYAYSKLAEELRRKGYELGQETRAKDGTIKLVATRWGA